MVTVCRLCCASFVVSFPACPCALEEIAGITCETVFRQGIKVGAKINAKGVRIARQLTFPLQGLAIALRGRNPPPLITMRTAEGELNTALLTSITLCRLNDRVYEDPLLCVGVGQEICIG